MKFVKTLLLSGIFSLNLLGGITLYAQNIVTEEEVVTTKTVNVSNIFFEDTTEETEINLDEDNAIGKDIYEVQYSLKYLNYYSGKVTGILDEETKTSIESFQSDNSITINGEINEELLETLKKYDEQVSLAEEKLYKQKCEEQAKKEKEEKIRKMQEELKAKGATKIDWFKKGQYLIPRKTYFNVTDVLTGKTFRVFRYGGSNHADCEPASAKDSAIMKSVYGGKWSWSRRSIAITTDDNMYRIAASMAGMPHGGENIKNNDFNGHFDIHMYNSKVHYDPSNNIYSEYVEPMHQKAITNAVGK